VRPETAIRIAKRELGALEASHKEGRSLDDFGGYRDDPVGFIRDVLGEDPWSIQEEIARAVQGQRFVAVQSCNSAGKDWVAARLALWWVYARRGLALVTGPTERQVKEVVLRTEVRNAFHRVTDLPGDLYGTTLRVEGAGGVIGMTSADASRLTGFHHPNGVLVIVTEAQGCEALVFEAALANTTGDEDAVLAVGNPLSPSGRFFEITRSGRWRTFKVSAFDHPNVAQGEEVIPGAVTRAFIQRMEDEYGKESSIYRSRVLGEWPTDDDEALVELAWLEEAADRFDRWQSWGYAEGSGGLVLALDVARYGGDRTVLAIRRGRVLTGLIEFPRLDTMKTAERVRAVLADVTEHEASREPWTDRFFGRKPKETASDRGRLVVDAAGLGAGVYDRLGQIAEKGWTVDGFNASHSALSDRADRYLNLRAEAFWALRQKLERGEVAVPRHEDLWRELRATRWSVHQRTGRIAIEGKDLIRSTLGRSPDFADAVAMAFAPGTPESWVSVGAMRVSI